MSKPTREELLRQSNEHVERARNHLDGRSYLNGVVFEDSQQAVNAAVEELFSAIEKTLAALEHK